VWGGRASDRHITLNSGFIDLIDHGDQIMADNFAKTLIQVLKMLETTEVVVPNLSDRSSFINPSLNFIRTISNSSLMDSFLT
jgi:hypothetical protein